MPTESDFVQFSNGEMYIHIDGNKVCDIPEFSISFDEKESMVHDFVMDNFNEATLTCTIKFNWNTLYKLTGFYDWVVNNCPNRRVAHLVKYGKNTRIKKKNFFRAIKEIFKLY